jgi:hypothetical protein
MSDTEAQFSALRRTADPAVADAIRRLIETGADHELNRINLLDFSARTGLDEERVISGFLHASRLGLFDLTWNVLCPGCGGVLDAHSTLKSLRHDDYQCGLCACGYEASIDEQVEVAFTVSPQVRRIAAHDPNALPIWDYFKQIFWSSGIDFDEASFAWLSNDVVLKALELPPGEQTTVSLQLPPQFIIVFEPVTHAARSKPPHCVRDRCNYRSTTGPACGCCLRFSSPPMRCITCSASASRSSPPSGC